MGFRCPPVCSLYSAWSCKVELCSVITDTDMEVYGGGDLAVYSHSAHVIRMWTTTFCSRRSRVLSVEIVFLDAKGGKIQASISRDILRHKRVEMDEDDYFQVIGARVVPNDGKDRATRHAFRLVLDVSTILTKQEPYVFRTLGLTPMSTSDMVRYRSEDEYLVDKVGLLTSLSPEREYVKDDKDLSVCYIEIRDPTGCVECVLYDKYVEDLKEFLKNQGAWTPVILVQFARVVPDGQVLFGDVGIETVKDISRVLFNPGTPEQFEMISWLIMSGVTLEGNLIYVNMDLPSLSLRDDFLLYHPRKNISQLMRMGKGGVFVVFAKISGLLENASWWFSATKHHACETEGISLFNCDGYYTVIPRYNVKVEVTDDEDITHFTLGDEDIFYPHFRKQQMGHTPIFQRLLGKRMLFLVERKSTSLHVQHDPYRVRRVCSDPKIVRMFMRREFFHADRRTRSTIARLLGEHGDAEHFNNCQGSSHASAQAVDNFGSESDDYGQCSSSGSVSVNRPIRDLNEKIDYGPPVVKHCVHINNNNQQ